ncbi:hypothetical protein GCM10023065_30680 [Microbacterium laevaniformans]
MATITRRPFVRHLSTTPTMHVTHFRRGGIRHAGAGQAFWFRPLDAAISEVPLDDRELSVVVSLRTADLQQLSAPVTATYRIVDPDLAARRIDFSIDLVTGTWTEQPLDAIAAPLHGATTAAVVHLLQPRTLDNALRADLAELGAAATAMLAADARLTDLGIAIVGVRFSLLRAEPDVERALQTPARETIQQDADKATFARRALAVEREAAIGENELSNQVELARRQEELVQARGRNSRIEAEQAAAAAAIAVDAEAERIRTNAQARADADRALGEAAGAAEQARMAALRDVPVEVLTALAMRELAGNLPSIDHLTVTPDLLTDLVGRLGGRAPRRRDNRRDTEMTTPRAVIVHRASELTELLARTARAARSPSSSISEARASPPFGAAVVLVERQVRQRHGMAELHPPDRSGCRGHDHRSDALDDAHRGALLRRGQPPRSRLRRRPARRGRTALLHELGVAALRARR